MSTLSAVLIIAAVLAFSLAGGYWQIQRAQQTCEDARTGAIEEGRISGSFAPVVHDVGPDALRLMEDLDAHLDEYEATVADLYEPAGATRHPGLDRLRQAVRDEQQKGDGRDA